MTNITGRDDYIIAKALAYAIETINRLPAIRQEWGDQSDMKRLLDHMVASDGQLARVIEGVTAHLDGGSKFFLDERELAAEDAKMLEAAVDDASLGWNTPLGELVLDDIKSALKSSDAAMLRAAAARLEQYRRCLPDR